MELFDLIDWYYVGAVNVASYGIFQILKNHSKLMKLKPFIVLVIATVIGVFFAYVDWKQQAEDFSIAFRKGVFSYLVSIFLYSHILKYFEQFLKRLSGEGK